MSERLRILSVSPFPPSPPTFGAQRRIQGLLASLARRHDVDAIALAPPNMDAGAAERAMREYCREVVVLPSGATTEGLHKRLLQVRSLVSRRSYERRHFSVPALQQALDRQLTTCTYDIVAVEFFFMSHFRFRRAPAGSRPPKVVLDEHNIEYDLARQQTGLGRGLGRHVHNTLNWRKVRREEIAAWREADGVAFTSAPDDERARSIVPALRSRVVPNAVDVEFFRPRPTDPPADSTTIVFFGTFNYFPNRDGVLFFLREVWPRLASSHPQARVKIIGADPPPEVRSFQGPRVDLAGLVDDVRPHLAGAAVAIAPLLIGGGTRLKIVEAMAMAKPVVSTSLGAEGIAATPGREILLADSPQDFAAALGRLLDDGAMRASMGRAARTLVEKQYSWDAVALGLEKFFRDLLAGAGRGASEEHARPAP
jgi:polysaccharide biosynthesis protein PslH